MTKNSLLVGGLLAYLAWGPKQAKAQEILLFPVNSSLTVTSEEKKTAIRVEPSASQTYRIAPPSDELNQDLFGAHIQRSMTLLETSSNEQHGPIRILMHDQSIVGNEDFTEMMRGYLSRRFPFADIQLENRAIGGFTGERLVPHYEKLLVNAGDPGTPFPHFWDQMFGSGQAILALRDSYRSDLRSVKRVTNFKYVRFHDIFGDQIGIYNLGGTGKPNYNYSYIDQIYDGLLTDGVRPYVELSFMPSQLAKAQPPASTWYQPNNSPPKDYAIWDDMVDKFVRHLVERYGIDEVSQWYFEVWNEPDYGFPEGTPKQNTYFTLYDHTAHDVKKVDTRLRVGGPGTAESTWIKTFLDHCSHNYVPLDFVSSHMYGDESAEAVFNKKENVPRNRMVCMAVAKVHGEINASPLPHLPFILSEFNASYENKPEITDSIYMGPWLADTIRQCDGLVDMMSYWTFSDVFEEQGVVKKPFYGGFGLIAEDSIPKPAFNAFALLHKLGDTRLKSDSDSAIVTRRKDGTLVIALWNYAPPEANLTALNSKMFDLFLNGVSQHAKVELFRLDATHGNVMNAFDAMSRPDWPSQEQIAQLRTAANLPPAETMILKNTHLKIEVPAQGLAVLEIH